MNNNSKVCVFVLARLSSSRSCGGVRGGLVKIKVKIEVAYDTVLLTGIPMMCMTFPCHAPLSTSVSVFS